MHLILMGVLIGVGMTVAWIIISSIYLLFNKPIKSFANKLKTHSSRKQHQETADPTICEQLGDVKIYPDLYDDTRRLKECFVANEKQLDKLIEFLFPAPQITHNKFANSKQRLHNAFFKQYRSLHVYYRAYPVEDSESWDVINEGKDNLMTFNTALENLIKELSTLLVCDESIDGLMNDIKIDTEDVKRYDHYENA